MCTAHRKRCAVFLFLFPGNFQAVISHFFSCSSYHVRPRFVAQLGLLLGRSYQWRLGQFNNLSKHQNVRAKWEVLNWNSAATTRKRSKKMPNRHKKNCVIIYFQVAKTINLTPPRILISNSCCFYNRLSIDNLFVSKKENYKDLNLTTVELQLVVEIKQFLLDVCRTRTVVAHAECQQHVDLDDRNKKVDTYDAIKSN